MVYLLSGELVGVVAVVVSISVYRVPVMALTLMSPNFPSLVAFRRIERTSLSLTVELNFKARSTITFPHLGRKTATNLSSNKNEGQNEQKLLSLHKLSDGHTSNKTKRSNKS